MWPTFLAAYNKDNDDDDEDDETNDHNDHNLPPLQTGGLWNKISRNIEK